MPKVFISYRRTDTGYLASMLAGKLSEEFGPDSVFFDVDNIPLGVDFRRHLDDAVAGCDVLLALVGDQWLTTVDSNGKRRLDDKNDFNRIEIESALTRGIPVVPVLAGHAKMPSETDLPESLREFAYRNASELRSGGDLRLQLDRMISGLKPLLKIESQQASIPSHTKTEPVQIKNPTKGDSKHVPKTVPLAKSAVEPINVQTPQREVQPKKFGLGQAISALAIAGVLLVGFIMFIGSLAPPRDNGGLIEKSPNTGGSEDHKLVISDSVSPSSEAPPAPPTLSPAPPPSVETGISAVPRSPEEAQKAQCKNNLEQIGVGLRKFYDQWNYFPAAHLKEDLELDPPPISWRVEILKFLDSESSRWIKYDGDQAWDSPKNSGLLNPMPSFYRCPSHSTPGDTNTAYVAITGKDTVLAKELEDVSIADIPDGTSHTLMVVEASGLDIPWMKPQDIDAASIKRVGDPKGASSKHAGGTHVLMADGSVRFISNNIDKKTFKAMITRNGGEPLSESDF